MVRLQVRRHAFGAELSLVDGKIVPRFKPDDVIFLDEQIHPALDGAVRAVRLDDLIDRSIGPPTAIGLVMERRPEFLDYFVEILNF